MDMGVDMDMDTVTVTDKGTTSLFRFEPKKNDTRSVPVLFRSFSWTNKQFFGLFRCFGTVTKRPETKDRRFETLRNWRLIHFYVIDIGVDLDMDMAIFICFGLFWMVFGYFGYIETPKQAVSILQRNNQVKRLVSDSAETSFGSSFGYIETKLVS
jgi:hypothetical protein